MRFTSLVFAISLAFLGLATGAQAQSAQFKIGPTFIVPTGTLADYANSGFGASVTVRFGVLNFNLGGTTGYYYMTGKNGNGNLTVIPLVLGGTYNLIPGPFKPFIGLEAGPFVCAANFPNGTGGTSSVTSTNFGLLPTAGLDLELMPGFNLTGEIKYAYIFNSGTDIGATDSKGTKQNWTFIPITIGLVWKLGV
jgi:hypothetical protein